MLLVALIVNNMKSVIRTLSWARVVPDMMFAGGAILLFLFLARAIKLSFFKKQ